MLRIIHKFLVSFIILIIFAGTLHNPIQPIINDNSLFETLFSKIEPETLNENVFKLIGQDWTCITAGNDSLFNSMTASFGGWGTMFNKPVTWCFLRANRYTLELIRKEQRFTMCYFENKYKNELLLFGSKSGRNSNKMKETKLTAIKTPNDNIAYKEAKLIIECKLFEITNVTPEDFYDNEAKKFITDACKELNDCHKLVFGEIIGIWIKKP